MKVLSQPATAASLFVLAALLADSALAADLPKRKSGLWEMRSQMEGMPGSGSTMQMCVDQNTDNIMQQRAKEKSNCSTMDVSRSSGKTTIHSVCKDQGMTVTSDIVVTGNFESAYKSDMRMRFSPPQHGMSETHMTQEAKWTGPCKPGQKPGDMIMLGMPSGMNMQEMMNNPQVQEIMKRQRSGQ